MPLLATPHIAGYAVEAKRRGAAVIYEQTCRALGLEPMDTQPLLMRGFEPPEGVRVEFNPTGPSELAADGAVRALLGAIHDVSATSDELKATVGRKQRGALFDAMRKNYERDCGRRELASYTVGFDESVAAGLRSAVVRRADGFGMAVADAAPHYVLAAV